MGGGRLGTDFGRLWTAWTISAAGSAVGAGALPLVAILVLHASALQVSLLAALSGITGAAIALPLGGWIEGRRKRPVMVASDLLRFAALASVPLTAVLGRLTYAQLCVVGVVQTGGTITFIAASGAHLKALLPPADRAEGNGRLESSFWLSQSAGPPVGGALIGWCGATVTLLVDAVSFLLSALWIRRVRRPETAAPAMAAPAVWYDGITAGWRFIFAHRELRLLFGNAMVFGGAVMLVSPLMAVLMLRELHLAPWEYGLALGLPCLGGVIGSRLAPRLTRWLGLERVLLASGVLRTPWTVLLAFVPTGTVGLVLIVVLDTGLLLAAGVFNPLFATFRMQATDDAVMSRVYSAWSVSSRTVQPVMIAAGGALAAVTSTRAAIAAAGVLCLASALLVPRSGQARAQAEAREQPGVEEGVDVPDPVTADLERLDAPRLVPAVGGGLVVSERRQRVDQGRHQHQV